MIVILCRTDKELSGVYDAFDTMAFELPEGVYTVPDEKAHYFTVKGVFGIESS